MLIKSYAIYGKNFPTSWEKAFSKTRKFLELFMTFKSLTRLDLVKVISMIKKGENSEIFSTREVN